MKKRKYTKPPRDGCAGEITETMDGTEYDCNYNTTVECQDCIYVYEQQGIKGGKNPQAKVNQDG